MKEIITIQISKFLTNELVYDIAQKQWGSSAPAAVNRSRQYLFDELMDGNDCFGVIATTEKRGVIGRLHCVQNETDPRLWYYGDLFVTSEYRRQGIARQMIRAAMEHLSEIGASTLRCYVAPDNLPSRGLQRSVGFLEKAYESFNSFTNEGEIMYEIEIANDLSILPATGHEAYFVRILFAQNRDALQTPNITLREWREILSANDPETRHFLICKGAMPVAYLRLHQAPARERAEVTMLFVAKAFQQQGIGKFALRFAEQYRGEESPRIPPSAPS